MTNDSGSNADFWMAVAAAAPVIALSRIVGFRDPIILMANKIAKTARSGCTAAKYSNAYEPSCLPSRLSALSVLASETSV